MADVRLLFREAVAQSRAAADPHKQALLNVLGLITKVVELWPTGVIKQTNWSEIGGELRRGGRPDLADLVEQTMACVQAPSTGPAHVPADLASVSTTMSSVSTNEALLARVIALSHSSTNTQAPLEQLAESAEFTVPGGGISIVHAAGEAQQNGADAPGAEGDNEGADADDNIESLGGADDAEQAGGSDAEPNAEAEADSADGEEPADTNDDIDEEGAVVNAAAARQVAEPLEPKLDNLEAEGQENGEDEPEPQGEQPPAEATPERQEGGEEEVDEDVEEKKEDEEEEAVENENGEEEAEEEEEADEAEPDEENEEGEAGTDDGLGEISPAAPTNATPPNATGPALHAIAASTTTEAATGQKASAAAGGVYVPTPGVPIQAPTKPTSSPFSTNAGAPTNPPGMNPGILASSSFAPLAAAAGAPQPAPRSLFAGAPSMPPPAALPGHALPSFGPAADTITGSVDLGFLRPSAETPQPGATPVVGGLPTASTPSPWDVAPAPLVSIPSTVTPMTAPGSFAAPKPDQTQWAGPATTAVAPASVVKPAPAAPTPASSSGASSAPPAARPAAVPAPPGSSEKPAATQAPARVDKPTTSPAVVAAAPARQADPSAWAGAAAADTGARGPAPVTAPVKQPSALDVIRNAAPPVTAQLGTPFGGDYAYPGAAATSGKAAALEGAPHTKPLPPHPAAAATAAAGLNPAWKTSQGTLAAPGPSPSNVPAARDPVDPGYRGNQWNPAPAVRDPQQQQQPQQLQNEPFRPVQPFQQPPPVQQQPQQQLPNAFPPPRQPDQAQRYDLNPQQPMHRVPAADNALGAPPQAYARLPVAQPGLLDPYGGREPGAPPLANAWDQPPPMQWPDQVNFQQPPLPIRRDPAPAAAAPKANYADQLYRLRNMGFTDVARNTRLLDHYNGSLDIVLDHLLSGEDDGPNIAAPGPPPAVGRNPAQLAPQPVQPAHRPAPAQRPDGPNRWKTELWRLRNFGLDDEPRLIQLLDEFNGDVERVASVAWESN